MLSPEEITSVHFLGKKGQKSSRDTMATVHGPGWKRWHRFHYIAFQWTLPSNIQLSRTTIWQDLHSSLKSTHTLCPTNSGKTEGVLVLLKPKPFTCLLSHTLSPYQRQSSCHWVLSPGPFLSAKGALMKLLSDSVSLYLQPNYFDFIIAKVWKNNLYSRMLPALLFQSFFLAFKLAEFSYPPSHWNSFWQDYQWCSSSYIHSQLSILCQPDLTAVFDTANGSLCPKTSSLLLLSVHSHRLFCFLSPLLTVSSHRHFNEPASSPWCLCQNTRAHVLVLFPLLTL